MLVLTRMVSESIVIDGSTRVTVVACGNGRVKLGIEAPDGVTVDRSEVHERKLAEACVTKSPPPPPPIPQSTLAHS